MASVGRLEGSEVFRVTGARLFPLRGPGHGDTPRVEEVIQQLKNVVLCLELAADNELKLNLNTTLKSTSMDKTERSLFISNLGKFNM